MKFPKPGAKKKSAKIWNKKQRIHDIDRPEKTHCRGCGQADDGSCWRHYEGMFKHEYGKGTGVKVDDNMSAWLCFECDIIYSTKPDKNDTMAQLNHEIKWLKAIIDSKLF